MGKESRYFDFKPYHNKNSDYFPNKFLLGFLHREFDIGKNTICKFRQILTFGFEINICI